MRRGELAIPQRTADLPTIRQAHGANDIVAGFHNLSLGDQALRHQIWTRFTRTRASYRLLFGSPEHSGRGSKR